MFNDIFSSLYVDEFTFLKIWSEYIYVPVSELKFYYFTGVDMVKINQPEVAQKYNIVNSPSLVYFRKKVPLLYDGK
jgi:thioredoxin-related protein